MQYKKQVARWGNSAGVLLPREWLGKEVVVTLVDRTSDIKKEVFDILKDYLDDVIGIYLTGSYAREEQNKKSDIDILAISNRTNKEIISGKYSISIVTLDTVRKMLKSYATQIYPRLLEAKPILNSMLLKELLACKISKESLKEPMNAIKRIIRIDKESIKIDKELGEKYAPESIVYSIVLRLREMFITERMLGQEHYSNSEFIKWMNKNTDADFSSAYEIYQDVKAGRTPKLKISMSDAEKLLELLEKEADKYD